MRKRVLLAASVVALALSGEAIASALDSARLPKPRPVLASDAPVVSESESPDPSTELAPLPRPRPSVTAERLLIDWADDAASRFAAASAPAAPGLAAIETLAPLPRPRPEGDAHELALVMPPRIEPQSPGLVAPEDAHCVERLRALGVEFTEEPSLDAGTCSVPHPLKVTGLGAGVAVGPETILDCAETESLALWVKEVVVPTATKQLGSAPNRITQDSAYVCRTRYNDPNEKISEHAHANALDIAAFGFADRAPVEIGRSAAGSKEATFEAEIRKGSCTYFTTVLGPGSNAAHATHFHLDMAFRRGGYRLCELGAPTTVAAP